MKKNFCLFCIFLSFNLIAQKNKIRNDPNHDDRLLHFGFSLGINVIDFRIKQSEYGAVLNYKADVISLQPGFNVHAVSNFRLGQYLDFRLLPGISFGGERVISYKSIDTLKEIHIESNFIEIPLLIKYKGTRINNFRPYLIGGTNFKFDLAAVKNTWGESGKNINPVILKVFDYYFELGVGFDFYYQSFKLSTELKYSTGMRNMLKTKNGTQTINNFHSISVYTNVIDRLNSHMFMISFHFEG